MAFVYRELTEEEREYIKTFKIRAVLGGGFGFIPDEASVDDERNIYYFQFDGIGRVNRYDDLPPAWSSMIWEGQVFRVTTYQEVIKTEKGWTHVDYQVVNIYAPESFRGRDQEIMDAIQEAIAVHVKYRGFETLEFIEWSMPTYVSFDISQTESFA